MKTLKRFLVAISISLSFLTACGEETDDAQPCEQALVLLLSEDVDELEQEIRTLQYRLSQAALNDRARLARAIQVKQEELAEAQSELAEAESRC